MDTLAPAAPDGDQQQQQQQAYYPPPAEWHFGAPSLLSEWDASAPAAASSLGEANFLRSAEWSPDGTALLTTAEDRTVRIFDLPWETLSPLLSPSYEAKLQSPLYSALWHPYAHRAEPSSWCFLQACDGAPVKLVNAATGALQGSYAIVDHQERFVAPHSMAFTTSLANLYCGFLDAIEVFTLSLPGAQGERVKTTASKAAKAGQKGIISALATCPDGSGTYVAGSFSGSVVVYDSAHRRVCALKGVEGRGVVQIEYHPLYPHVVYVSSRRSPHLAQCFSLLSPRRPLANFPRPAPAAGADSRGTNQRGRFSLDRWGRYLVVGREDGSVGFYDVSADGDEREAPSKGTPVEERAPGFVLQAGQDAISTAIVHPFLPILATVSGSRHEPAASSSSSGDSSSSGEDSADDVAAADPAPTRAPGRRRFRKPREAKLRVWSFVAPQPAVPGPETVMSASAAALEPTAGVGAAAGDGVAAELASAGMDGCEDEEAALNGGEGEAGVSAIV